MPRYKYVAINDENKKVKSLVDARDDNDFRKIMRNESLVPIKYTIAEEKQTSYRLRANELSEFSKQLESMLASGITVVRAMEILKERDFKPRLKGVYEKLHKDLMQGYTMSEAMRHQPNSFPELLINMYASGEASGQLERVAAKMAVHYEKEHRLNGKVKTAMTYPIILLIVTVIVVLVIFTFILPEFFVLFENIELPLITKWVIAFSKFLQTKWYVLIIGTLILVALLQYLHRIYAVALFTDELKLRLPVIGNLLKTIYTARFSRTLSSLYSSGISMLKALEITSTIISNKYIENQFGDVVKDVRNGEPLSAAVGAVNGLDKKLSTTILIGEESGRLDNMLESTAESFDYEAEMATARLVQIVEPVMIVLMAFVVGTIMVSVMLPIMTIYQNADKF